MVFHQEWFNFLLRTPFPYEKMVFQEHRLYFMIPHLAHYSDHREQAGPYGDRHSRILLCEHQIWGYRNVKKPDFKKHEDALKFIHKILKNRWVNEWYPQAAEVLAKMHLYNNGPWREPWHYFENDIHKFVMPRRYRFRYIAVRLIANSLTPPGAPRYGRDFGLILSRLYRIAFGVPKSKELKLAFRRNGCKYRRRRYPHGVTEEEKLELLGRFRGRAVNQPALERYISTCRTRTSAPEKTGCPSPSTHSSTELPHTPHSEAD
jgi:hypothetical protein